MITPPIPIRPSGLAILAVKGGGIHPALSVVHFLYRAVKPCPQSRITFALRGRRKRGFRHEPNLSDDGHDRDVVEVEDDEEV